MLRKHNAVIYAYQMMTVADATRLYETEPTDTFQTPHAEVSLDRLREGWASLPPIEQRRQRPRLAPWAKEIIAEKLMAFSKVTRGPNAERLGSIVAEVSDNEGHMPSFVDFATPKP